MNAENADLLKSGKDKAHEISKKIGPILVGTCSQVAPQKSVKEH